MLNDVNGNEKKKRNQYAYDKRAYDHLHVQVKKGEKDAIFERAFSLGKTLNQYVNWLIKCDMEGERSNV